MATNFIMMIGISGSGKSTRATELAEEYNAIVVSTDSIRYETFGDESVQDNPGLIFKIAKGRIASYLADGTSVVFDAMNLTPRGRKDILRVVPKEVNKIAYIVNSTLEQAIANQYKRDRKVPVDIIKAQFNRLVKPTKLEGFDIIREI